MKTFLLLALLGAMTSSAFSEATNYLEKFSPHFSTNTLIVWKAPMNGLPESFWIYKRLTPQPFKTSVISNAVMIASLQKETFPKPSTNAFFIWNFPNSSGMGFSVFSILPALTTISFSLPNPNNSTDDIPDIKTVTKDAYECAARFGLSRTYLTQKKIYVIPAASNEGDTGASTDGLCARGIVLSRKLDGISFYGDEFAPPEGFIIEFGGHKQVRSFSLIWPNLERKRKDLIASPQQIIACIQAQRILLLPNPGEETYFQRLKTLANAKKFTITKITPWYGDMVFGEVLIPDVPSQNITPFAELEAVADFGNSNMPVRLFAPIVISEVSRLLAK